MTDKELIEKIQLLRQIKPRGEWVVFVKNQILNPEKAKQEQNFSFGFNGLREIGKGLKFIFYHKYAFASLVILFVVLGTFGFALRSTPGDVLFSLKKIVEEGQSTLLLGEEKTKFNLEQANKRLEELEKIAQNQNNNIKKINPVINEYKATVSELTKSLAREKDKKKIKEIVAEVKNLENKEKKIKSLGIELGENLDRDLVLVQLITDQVRELEAKKLPRESQTLLEEIRIDCLDNKFIDALEKILLINSNLSSDNSDNSGLNSETPIPIVSPTVSPLE